MPNAGLDQILAGETPTILLHRGQSNKELPLAFAELDIHGDKLGVGVVVRLPTHMDKQVRAYMSEHAAVPLRLADPELHLAPEFGWPNATPLKPRARAWSYFSDVPEKPTKSWVRKVVNLQSDLGATVALSASGWVGDTNPKKQLQRALQFVEESRAAVGDNPMLVNLTMSSRWLSEPDMRAILLGEVMESEEERWYLRFEWPLMPVSYRQLLDDSVLRGYKELANAFAMNDRQLILANAGLTGWLATAFGATGFSTGKSWGNDQKLAPVPIRRNRPGAPRPVPVARILDPKLMSTIAWDDFVRLDTDPDHADLVTTFMTEMSANGHTPELAGLHHVTTAGNLQALLATGQRTLQIRKRITAAEKFLVAVPPVRLAGEGLQPPHLPIWKTLLT